MGGCCERRGSAVMSWSVSRRAALGGGWGRCTCVTAREVDLGEGVVIPSGARVLHSYGAANRDERQYPDPDRFNVRRNPVDDLAFSYGNHACAGQCLARLEVHAVLKALATRARRIDLDGKPVRSLNNITRSFRSLPVRVG